jgi:hypothetical protein
VRVVPGTPPIQQCDAAKSKQLEGAKKDKWWAAPVACSCAAHSHADWSHHVVSKDKIVSVWAIGVRWGGVEVLSGSGWASPCHDLTVSVGLETTQPCDTLQRSLLLLPIPSPSGATHPCFVINLPACAFQCEFVRLAPRTYVACVLTPLEGASVVCESVCLTVSVDVDIPCPCCPPHPMPSLPGVSFLGVAGRVVGWRA